MVKTKDKESSAIQINPLKQEIEAHTLTTSASITRERILGKLEELLKTQPFDFERQAWREAIITLADQYFVLELGSRYPRVSDDLFRLKTELEFKDVKGSNENRTYKVARVQVPVFQTIPFGSAKRQATITGVGEYESSYHENSKDPLSWTLELTPPYIPEEVKVEALESEAFLHEIYAKALRERIMRRTIDLVRHTGEKRENIFDPTKSRLDIIWRPLPGEINFRLNLPPDPDPALIMEYRKQNYVVATWDVEKELSFRHYLKEFELEGILTGGQKPNENA